MHAKDWLRTGRRMKSTAAELDGLIEYVICDISVADLLNVGVES